MTERPLCIMETPYSTVAPCYIQLALEISDPSKIEEICNRIFAITVSFHITVDVENKIVHLDHHHNTVFSMPNTITKLEEAIQWSIENAKPNETTQVATLSANDRFIVYNSNHAWSDGGQWQRIVEEIQKPDFTIPTLTMPPSLFGETTFKRQIESSEPLFISPFHSTMTQFRTDSSYNGDDTSYVYSTIPISTLPGYDRSNSHIHQLTAMLVSSFVLSVKAFSGFSDDGYGLQAAINARPYLSEPLCSSISFGYQSGNILINCGDTKPRTIGELIDSLDKCLKDELQTKAFIGHTRYLLLPLLHPDDKRFVNIAPRGLGLYLTNIGRFKVHNEMIKDVMLNVHQAVGPQPSIVLMSYSVDNGNENVLHNHLIHRLTGISSDVMRNLLSLMDYALVNMDRKKTIEEFVEILKEKKNNKN
ncbi:hypothetical protein GPJ56_002563 [Histomonas meleagridis]|uniref:uncharacterized protein n=1 Tax=Histomonas meleagridis TaxID=135588 RepID=UPI00355A3F68|nr:hypothetical protein GPJ56_002563 [Histomonas meleagridis]KAH0801355.1 hypothetical protein GO595_005950 [Histomonas meleagridis]